MSVTPTYPALDRFRAHLAAHAGRVSADEAPMAVAVLEEFLASGAALGRGLREETAKLRPADAVGAAIAYLFILTVDAATHSDREAPLAAYAAQADQPLAREAGALYASLTSEAFLQAAGRRPVVGGHRGCQPQRRA